MEMRPIAAPELDEVRDLLVRAFDDDPWFNFLAAQDAHRTERIRRWIDRALRKKTFPHGETYATAAREGVALWIPPGTHGSRFDAFEFWWSLVHVTGIRRLRDVQRGIARVTDVEPNERHMELRLLAVEPTRQGEGIASTLLRPILERCDAAALPVALLSTKERNVDLYEHFGFAVTAEVAIPQGPVVWQMLRRPT